MFKAATVLAIAAVALLMSTASVKAQNNAANDQPFISDVTVLLPYASERESVSKTITASNGCFKWSCSNPMLVKLIPSKEDKDGCSNSAVISSQPSTSTKRKSVVVIAEDKRTGKTLRCDVYLDIVTKVAMKTRTRTINKGDEELLEIQGYDSLGNVFSSLEGLIFQWTFTPSQESASQFPALKVVPFSESTISVSHVLEQLEARNIQSSSILVQGADIGQVDVSARLVNHGSAVAPVTVRMAILQPLHLEPVSPLYLTPGTDFNYTLYTRKKDLQMLVNMPDNRYKWKSSEASVASVDSQGRVHTNELGSTQISVSFGVASPSFVDAGASRWVFVVEPMSLTLRITPANESDTNSLIAIGSKVLIQGQPYRFDVDLFDADLHKIDVTSHTIFDISFEKRFFDMQSHSDNYEHNIMKTTELTGTTVVTVRVKSIAGKAPKTPLTASQEILITAPVRVDPSEVLLPYIPGCDAHQFQLHASGGSGEYKWSVVDNLIASVSPAGVVTALSRGSARVSVVDARNQFNVAYANLRVAEPASLSFAPHSVEVMVGGSLALEIIAKDSNGQPFANCTALPFTWTLDPSEELAATAPFVFETTSSTSHSQHHSQPQVPRTPGACIARTLVGQRAGQTSVVVSLPGKRFNPIDTRLFAFKPLRILTPEPPALVTPGSSLTYILSGGPAPWYLDPSAFEEGYTASKPQAVKVVTPGPAHHGQFIATCTAYATQNLTFSAGNKPRQALQFPVKSEVDTTFECVEPYRLLLRPVNEFGVEEPAAVTENDKKNSASETNPSCASMLGSFADDLLQLREGAPLPEVYHLRYNQTYRLAAVLVDARGQLFTNSSSVNIQWTAETTNVEGRPVIAARWDGDNKTERELKLLPVEGTAILRISANGYDPAYMHGITTPKLSSPLLTRQIKLVLHKNVEVVPAAVSIVNHPRNSLTLEARHGSGNYLFSVDDPSVATIEHVAGSSKAKLIPRRPGTVHVTVTDACLSNSAAAVSTVHVSDVETLDLSVSDLLQINDKTELHVTALDPSGTPFDPSQYQFLNIRINVDNAGLTLLENPEPGKYIMKGTVLGASAVSASLVCQSGKVVTSNPVLVYVFAPFTVEPKKVNLVPGARYHVRWTGGPPVRYDVSFSSDDKSIATLDSDTIGMVIAGNAGNAIVTGTISATHSLTHERIVFGKAPVEISVQHLRGLRLRSATNRLVVGGEEDVWIEGYGQGETPLTLAGIGIRWAWTTGDPHVVSLHSCYEENGFTLEDEASPFSARIVAGSPGQTYVSVSVASLPSYLPESVYKSLSATLQIGVNEPLRIIGPESGLLLPPHSRYVIHTNKDGAVRLRYTLLTTSEVPIAHVSSQGVIETLSAFGSAVIVVQDKDAGEAASVMITVKPISQLQIKPDPAAARDIPVGTSTQFRTILRDDVGMQFHAMPVNAGNSPLLNVEKNYPDMISVTKISDNATIGVKALRPGQPVLHASLASNPAIEDYMRVYVGHMVEPLNPIVHSGGSISFRTSFEGNPENQKSSHRGNKRVWSAEDTSMVKIDAQSGMAKVGTDTGSTTVYYKGAVYAFTQVRVEKVGRIALDDNDGANPLVVSGVPSKNEDSSANKLHITFYTSSGEKFTRPLSAGSSNSRVQISHNFQVQCSIAERAWATASAVMDSTTGEVYCSVVPARSLPLGSPFAPDALTLKVSVSDSSSSYNVEETFHVKFVSRFVVVLDKTHNAPLRSVALSPQQTHRTVSVLFGSPSLTVVPVNCNLVSVTNIAPGVYDIDIQPSARSSSFTTSVEFRDSSTSQFENITVLFRTYYEPEKTDTTTTQDQPESPKVPTTTSGRNPIVFYLLILSVVLIVVSAVVLRSCTDDNPKFGNSEVSFRSSTSGSNQIPAQGLAAQSLDYGRRPISQY